MCSSKRTNINIRTHTHSHMAVYAPNWVYCLAIPMLVLLIFIIKSISKRYKIKDSIFIIHTFLSKRILYHLGIMF